MNLTIRRQWSDCLPLLVCRQRDRPHLIDKWFQAATSTWRQSEMEFLMLRLILQLRQGL